MDKEVENRLLELRQQGMGSTLITKQLQAEFPELATKTFYSVQGQVKKFLVTHNLNGNEYIKNIKSSITNRNPVINNVNNTIINNANISTSSGMQYNKDGSSTFEKIIELSKDTPITPTTMLKVHNLDPLQWTVISYKNNYWQSQAKGGQIIDLYQSKITVKPISDIVNIDLLIDTFNERCNNYIPLDDKPINISSDKMLEINICDLHLGKLSYDSETGDSYNSKIARQRFNLIINEELQRCKENKFEKILFVWCNDFFNFDGISNATTRGTSQDNDMKWQQLFTEGCSMLVDAIDKLSSYAPVETFYIASNHSRQVEFYTINYLKAWFRNYPNVIINCNYSPRYYVKYGINLIGFSHSCFEKKQNLSHLMAVECPNYWSETTYREFHLAHYHSEQVEEIGGVIYRWLPSVTGSDTYHNDNGYKGAFKRSYSFIYDKYKGLLQINNVLI